MSISGRTRVYALIGDPVEHSLSPTIQNAAFRHLNMDCIYLAFRVRANDLKQAISGIRALGICGVNVTMPHKINVIPYLDHIDEEAKSIGAINTILNKDGELLGYNTDGVGALNALKSNKINLAGKKIVILGAGGASKAITFTFAKEVGKIIILNRTLEKAEKLAGEVYSTLGREVEAKALSMDNLKYELEETDVLINATSVGMAPKDDDSPVSRRLLRSDLVVFDLVYNPFETRLLREAKAIGAKTIDGLTMLVHQGAASYEIWIGRKAPINIMIEAAKEKIKRKNM